MSKRPVLTPEQTLELLEQAVTAKGADYVYDQPAFAYDSKAQQTRRITTEEYDARLEADISAEVWLDCLYVDNGTPSCLVGHVLHMAGVPLEHLSEYEGSSAHSVVEYVAEASGVVTEALDRAQKVQDTGGTWGEALAAARVVIENGDVA